jgi:predicted nucleic acid-binding protein
MVIVYARTPESPFHDWAVEQISEAVVGDGAAVSAVSLAELCSEDGVDPESVVRAINDFGIHILDFPANAAGVCGVAYRAYRHKRRTESHKDAPKTPLPDFFIGAHAEMYGWSLATNDAQRFRTYFPKLTLATPKA